MGGDLFMAPTLDSIRTGVGANIPLVMGSNDDEFSLVFDMMKKFIKWVTAGFMLGQLDPRGEKRSHYMAANADVVAKGPGPLPGAT